ncbi:MAG: hypothetical protein ACRDHY_16600 [Anaerolineales bacterium]
MVWRAAVAGLEAAIAFCAALNAAYFLRRVMTVEPLSRRAAAFVLALISAGALAESIVALAILQAADSSAFASAAWILARSMTFVATGCISALVIRAMGNGK